MQQGETNESGQGEDDPDEEKAVATRIGKVISARKIDDENNTIKG